MRPLVLNITLLAFIAVGLFIFFRYDLPRPVPTSMSTATTTETAAVGALTNPATSTPEAHTPVAQIPKKVAQITKPKAPVTVTASSSSDSALAVRVQSPYSTPPESFDAVNVSTRTALVNILCQPHGGSLSPISGSGVLIDPRGIILTNAHVAQFVLLSESPEINLTCTVRTGAPARDTWDAEVLYIPPVWVQAHAAEITNTHPLGTGEHDYALLYITGSANNSPLPAQFPYLSPDTREAIGFVNDQVLAASYPAEFIGGINAEYDLYPDSSVTTIGQLLTFSTGTVDLLSLGGIIEAQSGSSGGAVVNAWDKLIGVITTTSEGASTADRDLRAVTLSYIDRDLATQTGFGLTATLAGDPALEAQDFNTRIAPDLIGLYLKQLSGH